MSLSGESPITDDSAAGVPRAFKKRYAVLALLVVVAVVLGLRRARTKPVASDAAPPENES